MSKLINAYFLKYSQFKQQEIKNGNLNYYEWGTYVVAQNMILFSDVLNSVPLKQFVKVMAPKDPSKGNIKVYFIELLLTEKFGPNI